MISRRRFLQQSVSSLAGLLYGPSIMLQSSITLAAQNGLASGEIFLIGDGKRGSESLFGSSAYVPTPGRIRIWRFGQAQAMEIGLPFFPHSFASHPNAPHRVITFEKWGRHLAEVDLETLSVVRITQAKPGRRFFGHGAHAGKYFFATQMDDERGRGLVSVMDAANHTVVQEFETQGVFPHDCQWLPGTNTLLIVNSRRTHNRDEARGNHSSAVWLDVETGKCSKQIFIETPEFGYAHFTRSTDEFVVLAGSYEPAKGGSRPLLSVISPNGTAHALGLSDIPLQGEALSLYLNEADKLVAATLPASSQIQVWNYLTGEFIRKIEIEEPRGLIHSTELDELLISSAGTNSLMVIDNKFTRSPKIIAPRIGGSGSHLYRIRI
jgi:uncharacterized protein